MRQVISVMGLYRCKNNTIGVSGYTRGISGELVSTTRIQFILFVRRREEETFIRY